MYLILFTALTSLWTCQCLVEKSENYESPCDLLKQWLESSQLSVEINKKGFHRELITTVELSPDVLSGIRVLLVHRWPRGVYLDPYQLASLNDHSNWQILLDSAIDLEVPAHKTSGFVSYTYLTSDEPRHRPLKVTIPVHGRYHEPSPEGKTFISVNIEPPNLLLRTEGCEHPNLEPHAVIEAPCTPDNISTCKWIMFQHQSEQIPVTLPFPVGDGSLVMPVCGGTLLVTMICAAALSKYMWMHRIV
ncbi:uncharacterized protein V6R79_003163 [Siganus canaliculatus]